MAEDFALVANASSAKQTRRAEAFERLRHRQYMEDLAVALELGPEVNRVLVHITRRLHAFGTAYAQKPHDMAYRVGQQDVAHQIMIDLGMASANAITNLMTENARQQREMQNYIMAGASKKDDTDNESEESDG